MVPEGKQAPRDRLLWLRNGSAGLGHPSFVSAALTTLRTAVYCMCISISRNSRSHNMALLHIAAFLYLEYCIECSGVECGRCVYVNVVFVM